MKWNKSFRIWRAYWTPGNISTLFPNTCPGWKNSENYPWNSTFLFQIYSVKINREQILNQFGSLTASSIETEEQGYTMAPPPPTHDRTRHGTWWIIIWEFQSKWRRNLDMSWQQKPKTVQPKGRITEVPHNKIRERSRGHSSDPKQRSGVHWLMG